MNIWKYTYRCTYIHTCVNTVCVPICEYIYIPYTHMYTHIQAGHSRLTLVCMENNTVINKQFKNKQFCILTTVNRHAPHPVYYGHAARPHIYTNNKRKKHCQLWKKSHAAFLQVTHFGTKCFNAQRHTQKRKTYRLASPPSVIELLSPSKVESGIKYRVVHGIANNSMGFWVQPLWVKGNLSLK